MLPLMTCGDIFWINLVIYLSAVGGLGFSVLFGVWPAAVIHALFVILTRK